LQSNYIPWRGYFDLVNDADVFVFYDEVQYTNRDWRSRNKIRSKTGLQWLTIPIDRHSTKLRISEVKFLDEAWQEKHFKTLYHTYRSAAYFEQLEELMFDVYRNRQWEYLSDLNHYVTKRISRMLGITTEFLDSKPYFEPHEDATIQMANLVEGVGGTEYLSGPSARSYMEGNESIFMDKGIKLIYKDYEGYPEYPQLASPFEPYVSIVDMLANAHIDEIPRLIWGWRSI